ncbi:MAG: copper-translocating P-type ATPase [Phycisphaerae bacterium]|nr:MAG: copper-translocating P-type ATPase [Phycisphaerae bacterium]
MRNPPPPTSTVRCSHCDRPVPAGLIDPDRHPQFCCTGCQVVYQTIQACGLDGFYRLKQMVGGTDLPPARVTGEKYVAYDTSEFSDLYVCKLPGMVRSIELLLEGVSCSACIWLIEKLPEVLPGVIDARLDLRSASVRLSWDESKVKLSQIACLLDRLGHPPHPARGYSKRELVRRESRRMLIQIGIAGALMGNIMLIALAMYAGDLSGMEPVYRSFFRWLSASLGVLSLTWPGATFFVSSWRAIRARTVNLDVPIAVALLAGGVAGVVNVFLGRGEIYFDSLAVLVFLLLVGRFIQYRQHRRADDAVDLMFSMTPVSCRVVRDNEVVETLVETLAVGDVVVVRSGDILPCDGVVVQGESAVDQALLTGESVPVPVQKGSSVHAGSVNKSRVIRVRATAVGDATRVGRLMRLVETGVQDKPQIARLADRVGGWFLPVVCVAAGIIFGFWSWKTTMTQAVDHTVAFLIVTCPCVLSLATPLTMGVAIGRLSQNRILVKSATALETLSKPGLILLDKTGTITRGQPQVVRFEGRESVKALIGEIERHSQHPIGKALHEAFGACELSGFLRTSIRQVTEGHDGGIEATIANKRIRIGSVSFIESQAADWGYFKERVLELDNAGETSVLVSVEGVIVAIIGLRDEPRKDSARAIRRMNQMGWRTNILSGDRRGVAQAIAIQVGIDSSSVMAQNSPEEKLRIVKSLQERGRTVMVGDGINDAAALASADVGIAVHGGAEASLAAADVYIARPGLQPVADLLNMSRRTMNVIKRNLLISLGYNLLAGILAAGGAMSPMLAAVLMPLSAATVLSTATWSIWRIQLSDTPEE